VAGESFCPFALKQLAKRSDRIQGHEVVVDIELLLDPNKKYSKQGKAAGVRVSGRNVRPIPSTESFAVSDWISQRGNAAFCKGSVFSMILARPVPATRSSC
jgi:hypothetical protein